MKSYINQILISFLASTLTCKKLLLWYLKTRTIYLFPSWLLTNKPFHLKPDRQVLLQPLCRQRVVSYHNFLLNTANSSLLVYNTYGTVCDTLKTFLGTQFFIKTGLIVKIEIWLMLQRDLYILTMLVYTCIQFLSREIYFKIKINY